MSSAQIPVRRWILLAAAVVTACRDPGPPSAPAERARAEFEGAYPLTASPTGVVRTFDLRALGLPIR